MGRAVVVYTAGRVALFALAALGLNLATGLNGPLLLLASLLLSSLLSYLVLARQREALAQAVERRAAARAARDADLRARLDRDEDS